MAEMETEGVTELVVTVIVLLVTVGVLAQLELLVIDTDTASPLLSEDVIKLDETAPGISTPFTFHWYTGVVPPSVGIAVNVIEPPEQIEVVLAVMATEGVTELTVTVPLPELEHPFSVYVTV